MHKALTRAFSLIGLIGLMSCGNSDYKSKLRDDAEQALAKRALELADENSGNLQMNRVYLLNALSHDPTQISALERLVQLVEQRESDLALRNETLSVLEVALFQVHPDDVVRVRKWIEQITRSDSNGSGPTGGESLGGNVSLKNIKTKYSSLLVDRNNTQDFLTQGFVDQVWEAISDYRRFLSDFDAGNDLVDAAESDLTKLESIYGVASALIRADRYIDLFVAHPPEDREFYFKQARHRLVSAASAFSSVYDYDLTVVPPSLKELARSRSAKLQGHEETLQTSFAKSISREILVEVYGDKNDANVPEVPWSEVCPKTKIDRGSDGRWEKQKSRLLACMASVLKKASMVADAEVEGWIRDQIAEPMENRIRELGVKQYQAYQGWAANRLKRAWTSINKQTIVSKAEAKTIFSEAKLFEIDLRLVSPEVSQVYAQVLEKLIDELDSESAFDLRMRLMTEDKRAYAAF